MHRVHIAALAALATQAIHALPAQAGQDAPVGTWLTEERDSKIRIAACGKALCATIVWAKQSGVDSNNPNPSLRGRNIVGVDLSRDMRPDGSGGYFGSIYNPENGKTYQATMKPRGDQLEVGGCVLGGLLCGSETWARLNDTASNQTGGLQPKR